MSSGILYRRLAVVNILHDYYLNKDGINYFELPQDQQQKRLAEILINGRYGLADQLSVDATANCKNLLAAHKIVLKQTVTGFLLAIAVQPVEINNQLRYKPLIPVDANVKIQVNIKLKRNAFRSFTNTRFKPVFPACYYLTNQSSPEAKVYPSLSVPTTDFRNGYVYAMGETAVINGVPSRAMKQTGITAAGNWLPFTDLHYLGEADRILLPKNFSYQVQAPSVTELQFELKKNDDTVKIIVIKNDAGIKEALLNFGLKDDQSVIEDGMYTLAIAGNNNYQLQHKVYLDDTLYSRDTFAFVDLAFNTTDDPFSLLDNDGMLSGFHPAGCPQFEVRILSRVTYWKYYFKKDQPVVNDPLWEDGPGIPGFVKVIMSKSPYALAQDYRKMKYGEVILPNPAESGLSLEADKIYSGILIN